jgi:hypothetical protein
MSSSAAIWHSIASSSAESNTKYITTQLTITYPVEHFTMPVQAMAAGLVNLHLPEPTPQIPLDPQLPAAQETTASNRKRAACSYRPVPSSLTGSLGPGMGSGTGPGNNGGSGPGGGSSGGSSIIGGNNTKPSGTTPPDSTTSAPAPAPTTSADGGSTPTTIAPPGPTEVNGLAIEIFTSEDCTGFPSSPSARGVCNVFFSEGRSVRIIKAPTTQCAIGFYSRGYCNNGDGQDGNDQALYLPFASAFEGEYRSSAEPDARRNMLTSCGRSMCAV